MTSAETLPDPCRCPLCGAPNECAMETQRITGVGQPPCWCTRVSFPAQVLERVPAAAQGRACLCRVCARG